MVTIQTRKLITINTDPQRRCYNGCHYKSETVWTEWEDLVLDVKPEEVDDMLSFWRGINDYAVSQRGEQARKEFRVV